MNLMTGSLSSALSVPVIDLGKTSETKIREQLDKACREWGFFHIVNHGIPTSTIESLQVQMRGFFALSDDQKQQIRSTTDNPWGYSNHELTRNTRDWKEIFDYGIDRYANHEARWLGGLHEFQGALENYYLACYGLSLRLLRHMAVNLCVAGDELVKPFSPSHSSFLRLNHYPVCPNPERPHGLTEPSSGHMALNRHTDAGALTLLLQDEVAGLEVYHQQRWVLVEPLENAITINVGDIVQVWSNDLYKAALHRVIGNPAQARYSAPFFLNPDYCYNYEPFPVLITPGNPARYSAINWGEFRGQRISGDYRDEGEEVQIDQFRIQ